MTNNKMVGFLKKKLKEELPEMESKPMNDLIDDLLPILVKYSSIPAVESAAMLGLGIRLLVDEVATDHKVSADKLSLVAFEVLKRFAFLKTRKETLA